MKLRLFYNIVKTSLKKQAGYLNAIFITNLYFGELLDL